MDVKNVLYGSVRWLSGISSLAPSPAVPSTMPANTVVYGGAWGAGWVEGGFTTDAGISFGGLSPEYTDVNTAQQGPAILSIPGNAAQTISFTSLEASLEQLKLFIGQGTIATVAAGASTYGHKELTLSDGALNYIAIGFEGYGRDGEPFRVVYPAVLASVTGDITMQRTAPMGIPVTFRRVGGAVGDPKIRQVLPPTG